MSKTRQEHIYNQFIQWKFDPIQATSLSNKVYEIGEQIGFVGINTSTDQDKNKKRHHKYDSWIAREGRKNEELLNMGDVRYFKFIIDWVVACKIDLFAYDFNQALAAQQLWHDELAEKLKLNKITIPDLDEERVAFRFSDGLHFLYILDAKDLKYEGKMMGNCVGGNNYKQKIKNGMSLVLSVRDKDNKPHVTIEIDRQSCRLVQQYGKGNNDPVEKYVKLLDEMAFYLSDYKGLKKKETLKFLNS